MAWIRTDLSIVRVYVQNTWYDITCGKPKITRKQDNNKRIACNSHRPYEINPAEEEISVEIPEVAQHQLWIFEHIMDRQNTGKMAHTPVLVVYKYNAYGEIIKDYHLRGLFIEEISQDGNEAADIKGSAIDPLYMVGSDYAPPKKETTEEDKKKAEATKTTATTKA